MTEVIIRTWKQYEEKDLALKLENSYCLSKKAVDLLMSNAKRNPGHIVHVFSSVNIEPIIKFEFHVDSFKWYLLQSEGVIGAKIKKYKCDRCGNVETDEDGEPNFCSKCDGQKWTIL